MNCESARDAWQDACDDPLEMDRAAELERHLSTCAACRQFVTQMRGLDAAFADLRDESERELRARFATARPRTIKLRRLAPLAIAAAILLAAGIAIFSSWRSDVTRSGEVARSEPERPAPPIVHRDTPQSPVALPEEAPRVVLTGASAAEFLLVSEKTRDPRVHIFTLHAVYRLPDDSAATSPTLVAAACEPPQTGS